MALKKKQLTLSQCKKKNKIKPKHICKEIYKGSLCGETIDEVIDLLNNIKKQHPGYERYTVNIDNDPDYYDSYYVYLVVTEYKKETKQECDTRAEEQYNSYLYTYEQRRKEYEKLKKEYGD